MKLVLATNHLGLGGSESYLITVAEQFDRLGHEVAIYAPEHAGGVAAARERGVEVVPPGEIPSEFDAALVQDAGVSYELTAARPEAPQLFVAHSEIFDVQAPPQLEGSGVRTVVALNDRVADRMRRYAAGTEVVRLRQPIDTDRFVPRAPLSKAPRRALLLSNTPHSDRLDMLREVYSEAGVELVRLGGHAGQTTDPRTAIADVEIVIGYGRSILEAMACGRAAYVYDWKGGDGWVTAQTYGVMEADGFGGRNGLVAVDRERLAADLREYTDEMGPINSDLIVAHHRANVHAQKLIELIAGMAPSPIPAAPQPPLQEMARLVRLEWRARGEIHKLANEVAHLHQVLREQATENREQLARTLDAAAAERQAVADSYEQSLSWRVTRPLRALGAMMRRRLRRRPSG